MKQKKEQKEIRERDPSINAPFSPYQKFLIVILAVLQFTVILDFMVLSPLGDVLMKTLSIPPAHFGLVVSSYAFSAGLSGILAAGFADKFDRKKLLLFFYTGFILGTLCCAMANSYELLLGARIVTGFFGGVIGSICMAIITDEFAANHRGRVMGFVQMAFAASQILGLPAGLYISNIWNWHATFWMIGILTAVICVVILVKMRPIDKHLAFQSDKSPFLHLWHTLSNNSYGVAFIATAFMSIGGFMLMPFGSAYLINNIKITAAQLPMVYMWVGISSVIIMPVVGKLSDRIDKFFLFSAGSVLAIVMIIIYTNLSAIPLWKVIAINMILFMGIMSRMIPATTLMTSVPEMRDRGAFMSINSSLQQVAGGIAAMCAGFIVSQPDKDAPLQHYDTLGYVVSAVTIVCAALIYRVNELVKKKNEERTLEKINEQLAQRNSAMAEELA